MRGYTINRDDYLLPLRRIEGQVRGRQRMIEADEYCIDALTQVSSLTAAQPDGHPDHNQKNNGDR